MIEQAAVRKYFTGEDFASECPTLNMFMERTTYEICAHFFEYLAMRVLEVINITECTDVGRICFVVAMNITSYLDHPEDVDATGLAYAIYESFENTYGIPE